MADKDLGKSGFDLGSPIVRAAVEADDVAVFGEQGRETRGIPPVPATQQLLIERADLLIIVHRYPPCGP